MACSLCQVSSIYAAKLPSVGYEGPYQFPENEYGVIPDEIYDDGSMEFGQYGNLGFMATSGPGAVLASCPAAPVPEMQSVEYCPDCLSELGLNAGATDCDIVYAVVGGGSDAAQKIAYNNCASFPPCSIGCGDGNPYLGCFPAPAGSEIPLVFFALSCLVIRMWRRNKKK